jgi:hypothetical protein
MWRYLAPLYSYADDLRCLQAWNSGLQLYLQADQQLAIMQIRSGILPGKASLRSF